MGFFVVSMHRQVHIHPRFFGVKLQEMLTQRLMLEVEGTFAGRYGFVIAVLQVMEPIPTGALDDTTGYAIFPLRYQAVVFRPFRGEVLDGVVSKTSEQGFYTESGPLTVFVSYHQLPGGMTFDVNNQAWNSDDAVDNIKEGTSVRFRIMGLKIEATEISATGTIQDQYLGPIDD